MVKKSLRELMAKAQPILDAAGVMDIDRNDVAQVVGTLFQLGDEGDPKATALAVQIGKADVSRDADAN